MDDKLTTALRRLFIKFIISQAVMLVVLVALAVLSTAYYKGKLAGQLSSAIRFPILSGDTRQVMYDMSDSVTKNFNVMEWRPASNQGAFTIPTGAGRISHLVYSYSATPLSFDEKDRIAAGSLYFYYNRWPSIGIACVAWALLFAVSGFLIGAERRRIVRDYNTAIELQVKESQVALAAQVAHDIRSPVFALDAALKNMEQLPEQQRVVVRHAVNRIRDVANGLLEKNRPRPEGSASEGAAPTEVRSLSNLVEPVISEKRLQYGDKPGLHINFQLSQECCGLFAKVQPVEFGRMLSNLINNAAEALGGKGKVDVRLALEDNYIILTIADTGKGIPPEILSRLGQRGETHGKAGGSGLGLYHARTTAESWGGGLTITSTPGKGTTVAIKLPKVEAPDGFVAAIELVPGKPVIVLDDDTGIHQIWRNRFEAARLGEHNIEVLYFREPDQLRTWAKAEPAKAKIAFCLFDYELSGYKETGLSLAEELGLCAQTILVTSRSEEKQVIEDCARLNIRLMTKGMAEYVPISTGAPSAAARAVLLDDDALTHMTWEMAADAHGVGLRAFTKPEDFFEALETFPKDIPLYIDSDLGENMKGEDIAAQLKEKGFINICLATAHPPEKFAHLPWLKVMTKAPPWA